MSLNAWRAVKEYLPRDWGTRRSDGTIGPRTGTDSEDYLWGLTRFLDEARILAQFDHPNLVRVYRVFEAQGTAYMVTEYVEGQTLAAALRESEAWSEPQVRELLDALADGLAVVHGAGLLHRDIKPGNVMMRPDGTPVLIDFGAARQAMGRQSRSVTAVLTPGYAPIEQYSPRGNQGPWTDIYALGALAYEALSGQVPEDATERVLEDRLRPMGEVAPQGVSAGLSAAIDAALAVDGRDRPQGLDAWRAQLAGSAGVAPVSARPRGGESFGAAAATGAVRGDVVAERSGRAAAGAAVWRRWWLPGAAAAGLVGVALVVALTAPWSWNGAGSEETLEPSAEQPESNLDPPPVVSPAAVEEALGLDRAAREEIQWGLKAAGFDMGVADGRFGPQTRDVIRNWQAAQAAGHPTGYLDRLAVQDLRAAGAPLAEADRERLEAERLEAERLEAERLEAERLEAERLEAERLEAERLEAERLEAERLEAERLEAERLEAERLEAERLEAERLERERLDRERLERERLERERLERERRERERRDRERREREREAEEDRKWDCMADGGNWRNGRCEPPETNLCRTSYGVCQMFVSGPVGRQCYCNTVTGPVSGVTVAR